MEVKLAIVGAREFQDYETLKRETDKLIETIGMPTVVVSGGAKGADTLGERYAREKGIKMLRLLPDWKTHGRAAGLIRNTDIVKECTHVIAFIKGESRGTKDTIAKATKAGKNVTTIHPSQ